MRLVRVHDLYVARVALIAVLAAWSVLLGLDLIIALADQMGRLGQGDYGFVDALMVTLLSGPRRAYELFPTAAVIGSLLGLGGLAAGSELVALRAAGLSRARISLGVLMMLAVVTAAMVLVGETVGPSGERAAQSLATRARSSDMISASWSGLWVHEGDAFLNARTVLVRDAVPLPQVEMVGVQLFQMGPAGNLVSLARARRAVHDGSGWTLFELRRIHLGSNSATVEEVAEQQWQSQLDGDTLVASVSRPRYMPSSRLSAGIEYMRRNGVDPGPYEAAYWARWFYPFNVLALCLAAMPFAFGPLRSGGFGKRLFAGIVFGLAFFLLNRLAVNMAGVFGLDMRLANAVPPLVVLLVSGLLFRRRR